uniref:Mannose-6-phosphate isomerase (Trinotate prediction) n=1 Tax=Myxobolus squamalis TaxID=59785 RepID=A0A6B2G5P9_MYXSQ
MIIINQKWQLVLILTLTEALTPFKALVGIRNAGEIYDHLVRQKPLSEMIGHDLLFKLKEGKETADTIKKIVAKLISLNEQKLSKLFEQLLACKTNPLHDLFSKLNEQHHHDIGCLFIYFMNFIELNPGQAIFIGPNVPHAYLKGGIINYISFRCD